MMSQTEFYNATKTKEKFLYKLFNLAWICWLKNFTNQATFEKNAFKNLQKVFILRPLYKVFRLGYKLHEKIEKVVKIKKIHEWFVF